MVAETASTGAVPDRLEVLTFELDQHSFAFALSDVKEVLRAVAIAALPGAPALVEGVINVRGEVVPVLDIRARFGLPPKKLASSDHLVVVTSGRRSAIRVDRCIATSHVQWLPLAAATNLPAGVSAIAGFGLDASGTLVIHDLRAFLAEGEALALERSLATYAPASVEHEP